MTIHFSYEMQIFNPSYTADTVQRVPLDVKLDNFMMKCATRA